jgi:tripartite-type tricarboxylate transporter receptor subunit TctC
MQAFGSHRAGLLVCFMLALTSAARADDYPSRTIKMIVPTGAGGITDILARLVGKSLSEQFASPSLSTTAPEPAAPLARGRSRRPSPTATPC